MKLPSFIAALLAATAFAAHAQLSAIHLTVEQLSKSSDTKPPAKGQPSYDKTQTRSLKIQVDNNSQQSFDGLVIKYWFIGHAASEHESKVIVEGERKATIGPRGHEMVESEVVSKQHVEAHTAAAKATKGTAAKTTKVPASGEKLLGYAVRAIKDGKVLAEYFSDPNYKAIIDKPGAAAPATAAVGAKPGAKPAVKK